MTLELGVVQLLQSVLHVLPTEVLHHPGAVLKHVGVADIAGVSHVVLQVLPAAGGREPRHHDPVLAPPGRRSPPPSSSSSFSRSSSSEAAAAALGELHPESVAVIVVPVTGVDCVLSVSGEEDPLGTNLIEKSLADLLTGYPRIQQMRMEGLVCFSGQ